MDVLADFSIRLTSLKQIPITMKPCGNGGGDTDDGSVDDVICT